jgi:hypothetical protein
MGSSASSPPEEALFLCPNSGDTSSGVANSELIWCSFGARQQLYDLVQWPLMATRDEKPEPPRIYVTLPAGARRLFDQLVARAFYGDKHAEVARHLIIEKLDELLQKGRLKEPD